MKNKLLMVLAVVFSVSFAAFVVYEVNELSNARDKILKSANVADVTNSLSTKVMVSNIDLPLDGNWVKRSFDDNKWSSLKIPSRRLVNEKDYGLGKFAYYRIKISKDVFNKLPALENETSLALQYVLFSRVDILVNGQLVKTTTNPQNALEYIQVFPVPTNQDVVVALKGFIKDTVDTGIDHRVEILIGKTNELNELFVAGFKRHTAFQLIFIICKGSILFIFALIFLILKVERSFTAFFYFGLFTLIEELISADYFNAFINFKTQVYLYNYVNVGATIFVFLFFAELFKINVSSKRALVLTFILSLLSSIVTADALHKNQIFDISGWMKFWNAITVMVMIFYVPKSFKADKILFSVLLVVISLYLWGVAPSSNIGLNLKRYGNLLLFVMVAYQTFVMFRREQNLLQAKDRQLLEQEKDVVMGKTASLLAHDIRKPLDQMKLLIDKLYTGEADKEFIDIAKKDIDYSIENVNQQISNMMNYSRNTNVTTGEVSFYKVLSHGIRQIVSTHQEMNLELEYNFKAICKIVGDEARLNGIITNLISNAIEAIRDIGNSYKGKIRFETFQHGDSFIFKIFNDGPEIPEKFLSEIFRPLFTHGKSNGTGFGLASVAKAVDELQGSISVKNVTGQGVEFTLVLIPAASEDTYSKESFLKSSKDYEYKITKQMDPESTLVLRVLVLGNSKELEACIRKMPFKTEIQHTSDIKSAKELITRMRFDLYLLDKDLGGNEIADELNYLGPEVALFSTAETLPDLELMAKQVYKNRKLILLVDDTKIFRIAWQMFHGSHNIQCLASPEEALEMLSNTKARFDAFVLDFHYSNSSLDGQALAYRIKEIVGDARIFISSSVDQQLEDFRSISKKDYDVRKLL